MSKTAVINTRVEPAIKKSVEAVLRPLGLTTTEAVNLFFHQVVLRRGLPFEVSHPNAATSKALQNVMAGKNVRRTSLDALKREFGDA
ncbi:MAG: type II toxin-antitoxin system RelB/DinJ family antitoxin [Bdellovibrionales bacterium]